MKLLFQLLSAWLLLNDISRSNGFNIRSTRQQTNRMAMNIAPYKKPRAQNVEGNLYVDEG
jgi:hypothetical protein